MVGFGPLSNAPHHHVLVARFYLYQLGFDGPAWVGQFRARCFFRHWRLFSRFIVEPIWAMQSSTRIVWFYLILACWLFALWVWRRVDRSMQRDALQAISEEEDAAASIGINVTRTKLQITVLSAVMTCLGGVLYAQYQLYINPETVSGVGISLQIVFGVIAGGMFVMLGPTFGAVFLLALQEILRILIGNQIHGLDLLIYGALLIFFIIKMPNGILGTLLKRRE